MELKEFVAETIRQILDGVGMAQEHAAKMGAGVNPGDTYGEAGNYIRVRGAGELVQMIEFDVVVTTRDSDKSKGGIGIFVGPIGAGTQGEEELINSRQDHIRFTIPLQLPTQKKG